MCSLSNYHFTPDDSKLQELKGVMEMTIAIAEQVKIGDYKAIVEQIGGGKFLAMTGSKFKYFGYSEAGYVYLMIGLSRNPSKAQYLKIQLNSGDLYDLTFSRIKKTQNPEYKAAGLKIYDETPEIVKEYTGVYADQLQDIFTSVTGLLTRLY